MAKEGKIKIAQFEKNGLSWRKSRNQEMPGPVEKRYWILWKSLLERSGFKVIVNTKKGFLKKCTIIYPSGIKKTIFFHKERRKK